MKIMEKVDQTYSECFLTTFTISEDKVRKSVVRTPYRTLTMVKIMLILI